MLKRIDKLMGEWKQFDDDKISRNLDNSMRSKTNNAEKNEFIGIDESLSSHS